MTASMLAVADDQAGRYLPGPLVSRSASRLLLAAVLAAPAVVVLQPFAPGSVQAALLVIRFFLLPLALVLARPREIDWPSFIALAILVLATGFPDMVDRARYFWLNALSLVGSVILFRAGLAVASNRAWDRIWTALAHGVTLVNLLTLAVLAAAAMGWLDLKILLLIVQHDPARGLTRFALGNAIEVPFVMSALLYAAVRCAPRGNRYPLAALVNLATAVVSQSRLVILMALLIFLEEWVRASRRWRWAYAALILAGLYVFRDALASALEPILQRFQGQDYGSGDDRGFLARTILAEVQPWSMLVGKGLTSSADFIQQLTGIYRTVESLGLEVFFELGIAGVLLIPAALFRCGRRTCLGLPGFRPVVWLMLIELLFFMPIFYTMQLVFFALGALSAPQALRTDRGARPSGTVGPLTA